MLEGLLAGTQCGLRIERLRSVADEHQLVFFGRSRDSKIRLLVRIGTKLYAIHPRRLAHFAFHAMGVRVVSVRHADGKAAALEGDPPLEGGDTVVLSGKPAALALAEEKLLGG